MNPKKRLEATEAQKTSPVATGILAVANILIALIEAFGFPGAVLAVGFYILNSWSTDKQKEQFIDMYVLGKGIGQAWPIIVLSVLFLLALWAQNSYLKKRLKTETDEVARIGGEKSALQEAATPGELEHTKPQTRR